MFHKIKKHKKIQNYSSLDANMNHAMVSCILHRMERTPKTTYKKIFSDVESGQYYSSPVTRVTNKKIINGYDNGARLDSKGTSTRAECSKMLPNTYKLI